MKTKTLKTTILLFGSFTLVSMAVVKTNLQDTWKAPEAYRNMTNPYADTEDEDRIGRTIYSKQCQFCHGRKGKGDGNQANLLQTKVADFSSVEFKDQTDGSIYYKINTGRNEMPGFEKTVTDEEDIWMLVNYIKGFQ